MKLGKMSLGQTMVVHPLDARELQKDSVSHADVFASIHKCLAKSCTPIAHSASMVQLKEYAPDLFAEMQGKVLTLSETVNEAIDEYRQFVR